MAITKVSQLARLSNPALIQALTGRSYNNFGQMLSSDDIFEVSFKRNNTNGYYSVGASLSDIRFDLVGKYSLSNKLPDNSIKPILTYDTKYSNRYKEGDLLFYPKLNGLTLIRKTNKFNNTSGADEPADDNIAPYGLANLNEDPNKNYQWQYAVLPWDSWMVPLFSTIRTIGKIKDGYWQEVRPYRLFEEPIFTAAYEELDREFNVVADDTNSVTGKALSSINNTSPSINTIYSINTQGLSAVYNVSADRYIVKVDAVGKTKPDIISTLQQVANAIGSTSTNIKIPFFSFTVNASSNSTNPNIVDINYISVPYYTLSNTELNKHVYCCLGNTISDDTSSYNISPVWAYEMIKNKETKVSSSTLDIVAPEFQTSASRTGINIKTPVNPLTINTNGKLELRFGSGLKLDSNALVFDDTALQALSNRVTTEVNTLNTKINKLETDVNTTINNKIAQINAELIRINNLITENNKALQTTLYGAESLK